MKRLTIRNLKIRTKFMLMYVFCVLLPLILTDAYILYSMNRNYQKEQRINLEYAIERIEYNLKENVNKCLLFANSIYSDQALNDFLNKKFDNPLDYYDEFTKLTRSNVLSFTSIGLLYKAEIYVDNNTILSGGKIINMDRAKNTDWYKEYIKSNKKTILYTYYDKSKKNVPGAGTCRTISIIQGLDNYGKDKSAKLLKVDIDYNLMLRHILNEKISDQIYVCNNDYIIFSNLKNDSNMEDFIPNDSIDDNMATIKSSFKVGNQEWEIIMMATSESFWDIIFENKGIIVLILLNFIIPTMVIYFIGRSITNRLSIVATYIGKVEKAQFEVIECQEGEDEIGKLIKSYNLMVLKIKDLIEVVFKGKTEKQALELSKKQAELKAIQSQVNPHFLYNTLETIRMRSLIKHEEETADIIGELAILFRKSMSWGSDFVTIEEEMSFVEKYINIQKYRFGDKIKYSKYVMETCKGYRIPKLVIANFVENACIHGIESSVEDGVISVTVTEDDMYLYIEVSDNGEGISNAELNDLRKLLDHADSKLLNKTKSTGILNSFLRLQMYCDGKVHFEIDSEPNSGTDISICIPLNCTNSVVHNVSPNVKQEV